MARYDAIRNIMRDVEDELVVCNIGLASRELYEIDDRSKNFYMIGSMGLASSIGLGLALAKPNRHVVVIDGDGSLLMNMGSMATVFAQNPDNLTWIVIDNGAYGSAGNQDTYAETIDGFKNAYNYEEVNLKDIFYSADASFIVYKTDIGNSEAPVIDLDPITIKERFMKSI